MKSFLGTGRDCCMIWKESYQLGIESIDAQHKKLLEKAGELVEEIEGAQRPEVYKATIEFLETYVLHHFQEEEAYIESLGYPEAQAHKKQHRELTQVVEKYKQELEATHYDYHAAKKMAGMLGAWLIYHVVHEDLKYTGRGKAEDSRQEECYLEYFANSTAQVLETMVGLPAKEIRQIRMYDGIGKGDVFIEIGLTGGLSGRVVFGFYKDFACRLVETMMSFAPLEVDELVCSALAEIANIASGNGTIAISEIGGACDICPPKLLQNDEGILLPHEEMMLDTQIGKMTVAVYLQ